jgi:hypothetical protein
VACMISVGTPHFAIARALDISQPTLYRHFADEVKNGKAEVHAAIAKGITAMALSGDKTMMIFYAKSQMGWRDSYRAHNTAGTRHRAKPPDAPLTPSLGGRANQGSSGRKASRLFLQLSC